MGKSVGKGVISAGFPRLQKEEMALLCGLVRSLVGHFWGFLDGFLVWFEHGLLLGDSGQRSCE